MRRSRGAKSNWLTFGLVEKSILTGHFKLKEGQFKICFGRYLSLEMNWRRSRLYFICGNISCKTSAEISVLHIYPILFYRNSFLPSVELMDFVRNLFDFLCRVKSSLVRREYWYLHPVGGGLRMKPLKLTIYTSFEIPGMNVFVIERY